MKQELSGYFFRNLLKQMRRRFALNAGEQALYMEIVAISNEEFWNTTLQISNGELTAALGCTEATLRTWRQNLVNCGLIKYCSGKSKRAFGIYTLVVGMGVKFNTNTIPNTVPNPNPNPNDYYKLNKTKQNKTKQYSKSHSENEFSALEKIENLSFEKLQSENFDLKTKKQDFKENSKGAEGQNSINGNFSHDFTSGGMELPKQPKSGLNQKETAKNLKPQQNPETEIYKKMVDVWFEVYFENFKLKPNFNGLDGSKIKSIEKKLKSKCEEFQQDWSAESAGDLFRKFLEVASNDKWLKNNFQLQILDSKFDIIIVKSLKNKELLTDISINTLLNNW